MPVRLKQFASSHKNSENAMKKGLPWKKCPWKKCKLKYPKYLFVLRISKSIFGGAGGGAGGGGAGA